MQVSMRMSQKRPKIECHKWAKWPTYVTFYNLLQILEWSNTVGCSWSLRTRFCLRDNIMLFSHLVSERQGLGVTSKDCSRLNRSEGSDLFTVSVTFGNVAQVSGWKNVWNVTTGYEYLGVLIWLEERIPTVFSSLFCKMDVSFGSRAGSRRVYSESRRDGTWALPQL